MYGVPSVIRQGLPRPTDHAQGLTELQTKTQLWAGKALPSSFLLNALHRISLICASLWFESQKEEGGEKRNITVFVTCPKREKRWKWESDVSAMPPGPRGHRTEGAKLSAPGTITGLWEPCFCARTETGFAVEFLLSRPRDGGPPYWSRFAGHVMSIFLSRYTMHGPVWWTSQEK